MARRITPSQIRSKLQQAQSRQRQQIQKFNSAVRDHNNKVRQHNSKVNQALDSFNRKVRVHNARVRANRARLQSYLHHLANQTMTVRYTELYQSTSALAVAYEQLDNSSADPFLSDLAERDAANSAAVLSTLLDDAVSPQDVHDDIRDTKIAQGLTRIEPDLNFRWRGAIFALSPENPDAARHFCTSSREILTRILNLMAPDREVFARFPNDVTGEGKPTRRAKVYYCLARNEMRNDALENFIDSNIDDLNALFHHLNGGAHGPSGKYSLQQLYAIKDRVEDAIGFVCEVAGISVEI